MTKKPKWLRVAVSKSSNYPWILGAVLKDYCSLERLKQDELAAYFGCTADALNWLSLCRKPRPEHFVDDITRIAERFGLDASKLAQVVRRVDVITSLQQQSASQNEETVLLAARDRRKENQQ